MNGSPPGAGQAHDSDRPPVGAELGGDLPRRHAELDGQLRRAFAESHPPGAPDTLRASIERLPATGSGSSGARAWLPMRALAILVVAVVGVAIVGAGLAARRSAPAVSATPIGSPRPTTPATAETSAPTSPLASPPAVVPWTDATAPPEPARPTPRPVQAGTRTCGPGDLAATAEWQGATGSMAGGIQVTNVSSTACVLEGPPKLVVIEAGKRTMVTAYVPGAGPGPAGTEPPGPGLLEPGDRGSWWLFWSNWCGADLLPTAVRVSLPGGNGTLVAVPGASRVGPGIGGTPRCDAPDSPSSLTAMAFEYRPPEPPLIESQPASVTISAPATATIGQDVRFTVALTNLGDQPAILEPCPTYSEDLIVGGLRLKPTADREYALNCSAIEDAFAPGATIVMEMRYPIPRYVGPGSAELLWSMDPGGPFDTGAFGRVPIEIVHPPSP